MFFFIQFKHTIGKYMFIFFTKLNNFEFQAFIINNFILILVLKNLTIV